MSHCSNVVGMHFEAFLAKMAANKFVLLVVIIFVIFCHFTVNEYKAFINLLCVIVLFVMIYALKVDINNKHKNICRILDSKETDTSSISNNLVGADESLLKEQKERDSD